MDDELTIDEIRRRNLDVLKAEADSLAAIGEAIRRSKANDPEAAAKDYANYFVPNPDRVAQHGGQHGARR